MKKTHKAVAVAVALNMVAVLYMSYLALYPFKVLKINNSPVPIENQPVADGTVVIYEVNYCKYRRVEATARRQLVEVDKGVSIDLPSTINNIDVGCHKYVNRSTIIPEGTPAGRYKITIRTEYQVTSLQKVRYQYETQAFGVYDDEANSRDAMFDQQGNIVLPTAKSTPPAVNQEEASGGVGPNTSSSSSSQTGGDSQPGFIRQTVNGIINAVTGIKLP
jgi:hypothetical protein